MDSSEQLSVTLSFMQAIAPVITRWTLHNTENPNPASNAQMILEYSVHLAARFASCYDAFHAPKNVSQG
jgi:hypothetical protein